MHRDRWPALPRGGAVTANHCRINARDPICRMSATFVLQVGTGSSRRSLACDEASRPFGKCCHRHANRSGDRAGRAAPNGCRARANLLASVHFRSAGVARSLLLILHTRRHAHSRSSAVVIEARTLSELKRALAGGTLSAHRLMFRVLNASESFAPQAWISRGDSAALLARADECDALLNERGAAAF